MSDIKKYINIISETTAGATSSGGFASVPSAIGEVKKRVEETSKDSGAPEIIEYGNWENSALTTGQKLKKKRHKAAKIVKSVYGESESEKKKSVKESTREIAAEAEINEQDLIINPSSLSKRAIGFIPKDHVRDDHEVAMAKSDLYQAGKNAAKIFSMIKDLDEDQGLEGWVQSKITLAADYLNTVCEYLEGKQLESASNNIYYDSDKPAEPWHTIDKIAGHKLESQDGTSQSTRMFASENKKAK